MNKIYRRYDDKSLMYEESLNYIIISCTIKEILFIAVVKKDDFYTIEKLKKSNEIVILTNYFIG